MIPSPCPTRNVAVPLNDPPIKPSLATTAVISPWRVVRPLPFEVAALPQGLFRFLGLPVVSYALPALIAIGQGIAHHRPSRNPVARLLRRALAPRTLRVPTGIESTV